MCDYGCGKVGKFYLSSSKTWCCCESQNSCPVMIQKNSESLLGREQKEESLRKRSESMKRNEKNIKILSERMRNGGAAHALSFIKNPSIPQSTICRNIKLLFPDLTVISNFPFLNYSLDTAIIEHKIVVEYDGWRYHEGPLGDPKKDIERQKRCEEYGWKFIRYKGLKNRDVVPSLEQLKEDIRKVLEEKQ